MRCPSRLTPTQSWQVPSVALTSYSALQFNQDTPTFLCEKHPLDAFSLRWECIASRGPEHSLSLVRAALKGRSQTSAQLKGQNSIGPTVCESSGSAGSTYAGNGQAAESLEGQSRKPRKESWRRAGIWGLGGLKKIQRLPPTHDVCLLYTAWYTLLDSDQQDTLFVAISPRFQTGRISQDTANGPLSLQLIFYHLCFKKYEVVQNCNTFLLSLAGSSEGPGRVNDYTWVWEGTVLGHELGGQTENSLK